MSVSIPGFFGIVLKKNEITKTFVEKEIEFMKKFAKGNDVILNEDQYLIGFSVAMNGSDLEKTIESLSSTGSVQGVDFVATSSVEGVIGEIPHWLMMEEVKSTDETTSENSVKSLVYVEESA